MRVWFLEKYPGFCGAEPNEPSYIDAGSDAKLAEWTKGVASWDIAVNWDRSGDVDNFTDSVADGNTHYTTELDKVCAYSSNYGRVLSGFEVDLFITIGAYGFVDGLGGFFLYMKLDVDTPEDVSDLSTFQGSGYNLTPIVATFDGISFSIYSAPLVDPADYTGSIDITPSSWWPYARADNSFPTYDATDGSQIIPTSDPEFYADSFGVLPN